MNSVVTANGQPIATKLPCTIEEFPQEQGLLPGSVVVEHTLARAREWR